MPALPLSNSEQCSLSSQTMVQTKYCRYHIFKSRFEGAISNMEHTIANQPELRCWKYSTEKGSSPVHNQLLRKTFCSSICWAALRNAVVQTDFYTCCHYLLKQTLQALWKLERTPKQTTIVSRAIKPTYTKPRKRLRSLLGLSHSILLENFSGSISET